MTRFILIATAVLSVLALQWCQHRDNVRVCQYDASCIARLDDATR